LSCSTAPILDNHVALQSPWLAPTRVTSYNIVCIKFLAFCVSGFALSNPSSVRSKSGHMRISAAAAGMSCSTAVKKCRNELGQQRPSHPRPRSFILWLMAGRERLSRAWLSHLWSPAETTTSEITFKAFLLAIIFSFKFYLDLIAFVFRCEQEIPFSYAPDWGVSPEVLCLGIMFNGDCMSSCQEVM
jgi:hypothetical protein